MPAPRPRRARAQARFAPRRWFDADFAPIRHFNSRETADIMTFPRSFAWPESLPESRRRSYLGDAVPPLFAQKIFRAASTAVRA